MKIKVTQKDIENGEPCSVNRCPIALAIRTHINKRVWVRGGSVSVMGGMWAIHETNLPRSARRFIHRFDNGNKCESFNFMLKL